MIYMQIHLYTVCNWVISLWLNCDSWDARPSRLWIRIKHQTWIKKTESSQAPRGLGKPCLGIEPAQLEIFVGLFEKKVDVSKPKYEQYIMTEPYRASDIFCLNLWDTKRVGPSVSSTAGLQKQLWSLQTWWQGSLGAKGTWFRGFLNWGYPNSSLDGEYFMENIYL